MPALIHHCNKDGKETFRLFSTIVDDYVTPELSQEELTNHIVICVALRLSSLSLADVVNLNTRLERARRSGTSSVDDSRDTSKWEDVSRSCWNKGEADAWFQVYQRNLAAVPEFDKVKEWLLACPLKK